MVHEVESTVAAPAPIVIKLDTQGAAARVGRAIAIIITVVAVFIAIGIGVVIYRTLHPVSGARDAVNANALRAREVNASVPYELMIRVAQRAVMVYVHSGRPPQEPLPPTLEGMPLRDLLARARQQTTFPQHPFYSGLLIHLDRMGWVWRLQSLSQRDSIPWIRASDGAVYPWK
jgi:hypothetical protein